MIVSSRGQHHISGIVSQHNGDGFDSQKSTEFFQYYGQTHTGLTSPMSKFLWRQTRFLLHNLSLSAEAVLRKVYLNLRLSF